MPRIPLPTTQRSRESRWTWTAGIILAILIAVSVWPGQAAAWEPASAAEGRTGDPNQPTGSYSVTDQDSIFKIVTAAPPYARSFGKTGAGARVPVTSTAYWIGAGKWRLVPERFFLRTSEGAFWFEVRQVPATQP